MEVVKLSNTEAIPKLWKDLAEPISDADEGKYSAEQTDETNKV